MQFIYHICDTMHLEVLTLLEINEKLSLDFFSSI